jgi:hypothetical protein
MNEKQLPSLLSLKVDPPDQMIEPPTEVVLPQVLEEVLALKNQRALELESDETDSTVLQQLQQLQPPNREVLWERDDNIVIEDVFFFFSG